MTVVTQSWPTAHSARVGVANGKPLPVCDYAGFAPFGFGYRRCPGEQLTIQVFEDFLRKVWRDKITFHNLNLPNARRVPIGPPSSTTISLSPGRPDLKVCSCSLDGLVSLIARPHSIISQVPGG